MWATFRSAGTKSRRLRQTIDRRRRPLSTARKRAASISRLLGGIEQLEQRVLLSVNTGLEYDSPAPISTWDPYEAPVASDVNHVDGRNGSSVNAADKRPADFRPSEILVGFVGDVVATYQQRGVARALEAAAGLVAPIGLSGGSALFTVPAIADHAARLVTHWSLPAAADVMQVVEQLSGRPGIAYAEPNWIMTTQLTPNDPSFSNPPDWPFGVQEHLPQMNVEAAWDTTTLGDGVVVAVVDTGIDLDHPDLNGNLKPGTTILKGSTKLGQDDNGHGTHVAGIIAAELNNMLDRAAQAQGNTAWNGGTVGAAPNAKIMPVKVLNSGGSGSAADIAKGINYAATNGANVINMSLGGAFSATISAAILNAYNKGVLVISAAGNGNAEASGHPASDPYSLSIAAVDSSDVRASFSNYGSSVDVAAPGVNILSTFIDVDDSRESGSMTGAYGRISGTSMASPGAAGVAALIWSYMATNLAGWSTLAPMLKVQTVASQLLATADNIDAHNPSFVGKLGAGRVNAETALSSPVTAPVVIAVGGIGAPNGTMNRLEVGQTIDIQFSHVMDSTSVLNVPNYELLYLGPDGDVGNDDVPINLSFQSATYDAFPGRGVQLRVQQNAPDGNYRFRIASSIDSGGVKGANNSLLDGDRDGIAGGDFTQVFTLAPRQIVNFQPIEPIGSLVYQAQVADTFNAAGDIDRFAFELDGNPQQVVSVQVNSAASATVAVTHSVVGPVPLSPDGSSGPLPAGMLTIELTGAAAGSYGVDVLLNAVGEVESHNNTSSAQSLTTAFVTFADPVEFPKLMYPASQAFVVGSLGSYLPGVDLDNFDDGNKTEYVEQSNGKDRSSNTTVTAAAAHDGPYGLADATHFGAGGWLYRADPLVQRGDTISVWVRSEGSPSGRGYFGFGSSSSGTLSMQMAANTGQLILGRHSGYNSYEDLAVAPQSWQANKWYRFVIDWQANGDITGRLYDSDGTTLLNAVTANDQTIAGGGIAFRSFYSTKHFDTVQKLTQPPIPDDVYSFPLAAGQNATIATRVADATQTVEVEWSSDGTMWEAGNSITSTGGGIYYVRVKGDIGAEYTLQVLRSTVFDANGNDSPATAQELTQQIAMGAIRPTIVGYYTDYNPTSVRPATPILEAEAGYVPRQITNISTFDLGTIDVLTIYEQNNGGISDALLSRLPAIEAWVRGGGRLTVHDRFASSGAASANPLIVGRGDILVTREFTADIDVITSDTLVTNGPGGTVDNTTLDGGTSSSHGYALNPTDTTQILSFGPDPDPDPANVSSFSYTLGAGLVYYSTIPLDFYLAGTTPFRTIYAPNTVAYAADGIPADEDFYRISLVEGNSRTFSTLTPASDLGQFSNTLDPGLEVIGPNGNQVAIAVGDGDASITFTAGVTGDYTIRVFGENGTVGEYILIDPPADISGTAGVAAVPPATVGAPLFIASELLAPPGSIGQTPRNTAHPGSRLPDRLAISLDGTAAWDVRDPWAPSAPLDVWDDWDCPPRRVTTPFGGLDELLSDDDSLGLEEDLLETLAGSR